jgi:hypothetical protein
MTGIKDTQNICKGQSLRRADSLAECLEHIQRHAMDLADAGPSNLLQLAQQNIPAQPAAGQAIGLAVGNLATDGIPLIIPVYRVLHEHAPQRAPANTGWDPAALLKSATAVAIAAHTALVIGGNIVEIWISKDKLFTDLKEEKLACPKNILCVSDECKGQEEGKNLVNTEPYCKKVSFRLVCQVYHTNRCASRSRTLDANAAQCRMATVKRSRASTCISNTSISSSSSRRRRSLT